MRSFFLTGASGLLGSNFFYNCKKKFRIFPHVHSKNIFEKKFCDINLFNIRKLKIFFHKNKIKYLIHAAAITNIENCEKFKKKARLVNCQLPMKLAKLCFKCNVKFIFISTDQLFNGKKSFYKENYKVSPLNYYATTKVIAEKKILKVNPSSIIIRTNFFGFGPSYRPSFSDWVINSLKNKKKINLFTDIYFNPVTIDFLIFVILKLLKYNFSGIINVSSDKKISKYDLALKLVKKFHLKKDLIIPQSFFVLKKNKKLALRPSDMTLDNKCLKMILKLNSINIDKMITKMYLKRNSKIINKLKQLK